MIEPLRFSVDVACPAEHAFATWTARTSLWWPRSPHRHAASRASRSSSRPAPAGASTSARPAGVEVDWGEVTIWEPPRRLGYLWHIRADRADATDVEITFVDRGDGTTRVEIEHRGWERLGARGPDWRDANRGGWGGVLPHFERAAGA